MSAHNLRCADDVPQDLQRTLAIDHADKGASYYRRRPDIDGSFERIAPHAVDAADYSRVVVESLLESV